MKVDEKFSAQPWTIDALLYIHPTVQHTWHIVIKITLTLSKKKKKILLFGYWSTVIAWELFKRFSLFQTPFKIWKQKIDANEIWWGMWMIFVSILQIL